MQGVAHIHEHVQNQSPTPVHKPNHKLASIGLFCQDLQELGQYQDNIWQKICLSAVLCIGSQFLYKILYFLPFYLQHCSWFRQRGFIRKERLYLEISKKSVKQRKWWGRKAGQLLQRCSSERQGGLGLLLRLHPCEKLLSHHIHSWALSAPHLW